MVVRAYVCVCVCFCGTCVMQERRSTRERNPRTQLRTGVLCHSNEQHHFSPAETVPTPMEKDGSLETYPIIAAYRSTSRRD